MPPLAAPGDRAAPFSSVGVFLRYILFAASRVVARFKIFVSQIHTFKIFDEIGGPRPARQ